MVHTILSARILYPVNNDPLIPDNAKIFVTLPNKPELLLFTFWPDELQFRETEFVGLTLIEAKDLYSNRYIAYMQGHSYVQNY